MTYKVMEKIFRVKYSQNLKKIKKKAKKKLYRSKNVYFAFSTFGAFSLSL